eukprot:Protomagalhaensia_sp_Gyna_25__5461@NODE_71_length_5627_cov_26_770401_g53_i0_p8_GENE_NODE_71_length_5627_cov_26_770401_g53_i0NODE_71_length_5627_cov_26_770401_g53_i0_p8_ORF_typecomplete_len106_score13_68_NODE_71_length_5627_cov_26_770401_g53_i038794196
MADPQCQERGQQPDALGCVSVRMRVCEKGGTTTNWHLGTSLLFIFSFVLFLPPYQLLVMTGLPSPLLGNNYLLTLNDLSVLEGGNCVQHKTDKLDLMLACVVQPC